MKKHLFGIARFGVAATALISLFACGGAGADAGSSGSAAIAASAQNGGAITLALRFVEFAKSGQAILSKDQVGKTVEQMNRLYGKCNIRFVAETYDVVDPANYGLDFNTSTMSDMDRIRAPFDTDKALVVVNTGSWDHGNMGPANAWTAMPGQSPSGAVLEAPVADNANIVAHELGHYLNLDHVSDQSNLMNPIIYDDSTFLSTGQCEEMRNTAATARVGALR